MKQLSDRIVARGKDIASADDFVRLLSKADCKVMVIKVPDDYFAETQQRLKDGLQKAIEQSNSVYQVIYEKNPDKTLKKRNVSLRFRYLSCEKCEFEQCQHYELLGSAVNYLEKPKKGLKKRVINKIFLQLSVYSINQ